MKFEKYDYAISDNLIPAIFYEDYSSLDDSEYTMLFHFLDCDIFQTGHWAFPDISESEFTRCDILGFYSNCILVSFYKRID